MDVASLGVCASATDDASVIGGIAGVIVVSAYWPGVDSAYAVAPTESGPPLGCEKSVEPGTYNHLVAAIARVVSSSVVGEGVETVCYRGGCCNSGAAWRAWARLWCLLVRWCVAFFGAEDYLLGALAWGEFAGDWDDGCWV